MDMVASAQARTMEPHAGFGQKLRHLRLDRGLSVRALATKAGVSSVTIWKWENRGSKPRASVIPALAAVLDTSPRSLARSVGVPALQILEPATAQQNGSPEIQIPMPLPVQISVHSDSEKLSQVIERAKQMIARASGTRMENISVRIAY